MKELSTSQKSWRLYFSTFWGILFGCLTFAIGPLSWLSANPLVAGIQIAVSIPLFPGLIGAMAIVGNVHAFSLIPGAMINASLNFGLMWLVFSLAFRLKRNRSGNAAV